LKVKPNRNTVLFALILIPYLLLIPAYWWYNEKLNAIEHSSFVVVNKEEMNLYHYNYKGELLQKSKISTGTNAGNKSKVGDLKTPEGVFPLVSVEDASTWTHDFGNGEVKGAYGPYFIRLSVPGQKGIGIHGTIDNASLGKRVSEGCIRMDNIELEKLVKNIRTPSTIIITPGVPDILQNKTTVDTIKSKRNAAPTILKKTQLNATILKKI